MKDNWEIKRLSDVCEVITKGTTPTSVGYKFTNEGVNFIKVESLTEQGIIIPEKVAYISDECHHSLKRSQLKVNDILFSIAGALGRIGIVNEEIVPANTNQALAIIRLAENSGILVSFLAKYFTSNNISEVIEKLRGGAAQQNLSLGQLNNLSVPIPPLPEQHRIVSILDETFTAIAKAKANAEQNLKNAKEVFESYLQGVFENKGEGWVERKLGDVCEMINRGISPKYSEKNGLIVLNQKCIRDHKINIEQSRLHDDSIKRVNKDKIIRLGDVLVNSTGTGTLGRVAQVREDLKNTIVDSHITIVRPLPNLFYSDFFGWALIFIEDEIAKRGEGCGGQTELARNTLKNDFTICFPSSCNTQKLIVENLDTLTSEIKKVEAVYKKKIEALEELKKSVLQQAFAGELKTS